jgi:hypothetical protein
MRADLMRERRFMDNRARLQSFVYFRDQFQNKPWKNKIPYKNVTTRRQDINFDCNRIKVESNYDAEKQTLSLEFLTEGSMMNFAGFAKKDPKTKQWKKTSQRITIKQGQNIKDLTVAAFNQAHRRGQAVTISVTW